MEQGKATLLSLGSVLIIFAVVLPLILFASGDGFEAFIEGLIVLFVVSPILFFIGLALLIAGVARGGQQQQQQVVVMSETQALAQGVSRYCNSCGGRIQASQRFCNSCGQGVSHG